jgi:hypothetical protein
MTNRKLSNKLTQAEYAAHRGITQSTVAKMISKGKIDGAYEKRGRRYLIDPIKADAVLEAYQPPRTNESEIDSTSANLDCQGARIDYVTYAEASRREKIAKAALLELRLKRERGDLIERAQVQNTATKVGTQVRVNLEAIPSRIAPTLVGMSSTKDIARCLQKEIKTVLTGLTREIAQNSFNNKQQRQYR